MRKFKKLKVLFIFLIFLALFALYSNINAFYTFNPPECETKLESENRTYCWINPPPVVCNPFYEGICWYNYDPE